MSGNVKPVEAKLPEQSGSSVVKLPHKTDKGTSTKQRSIVARLKKSGLDPQKLLDLALPSSTKKASTKSRHRVIALGFMLLVAVPSVLFSLYMFFLASDQYHSTTAFALRSSQQTPATEILGMVLDSGSESTSSNSYIVTDYLQSQAVVEDLPKNIDLETIYNREPSDFLFSMGTELSIEDKLSYWQSKVDVNYDSTSGVIYVETRSFRPEDSLILSKAILEKSEALVNQLSLENRRQSVRFAEESLAKAEARLKAIRMQMLAYREKTQEISPESNAEIAMQTIAELDRQVLTKETEKATLSQYLDDSSPRIRLLSEQIVVLRAQLESERQRLGAGSATVTGNKRDSLPYRIADYSELRLEEEFAQRLYTTALAGLEKARQDANSKNLYLATFIKPTLSESAQYPNRIIYSLTFFLFLLGVWIVCVLMYYNIRDRT